VDVDPDVPRRRSYRLARVHAHPHAQLNVRGPPVQRDLSLRLDHRGQCTASRRERHEHPGSSDINPRAAVACRRAFDDGVVLRDQRDVGVPEVLQQLRGVNNVREDERDSTRGEVLHPASPCRPARGSRSHRRTITYAVSIADRSTLAAWMRSRLARLGDDS
jgi:hypothetical protein